LAINLDNLEYLGNFLNLENFWKTQGIDREFGAASEKIVTNKIVSPDVMFRV